MVYYVRKIIERSGIRVRPAGDPYDKAYRMKRAERRNHNEKGCPDYRFGRYRGRNPRSCRLLLKKYFAKKKEKEEDDCGIDDLDEFEPDDECDGDCDACDDPCDKAEEKKEEDAE